jgi:fatty acid desaturase
MPCYPSQRKIMTKPKSAVSSAHYQGKARQGSGIWAWFHWLEMALHIAVMWGLFHWAVSQGMADQALALWFWPLIFFGFFNSIRFIAEHYGCPWDAGPLVGTRTIISNQANSFFWNNYYIGHHAYPGIPWYSLKKLHTLMLPEIERSGTT